MREAIKAGMNLVAVTMRNPRLALAAAFMAGLLAVPPSGARAARGTDPDWPCIQRKVPTVSAGMVWAGPPVDENDRSWEKSGELSELVERLAARRTPVEDAGPMIETFAKRHAEDKNAQLTLLFTGLLQTINAERNAIMQGIARYARQQAERAEQIKSVRDEYAALIAKETLTDSETARRDALEEQLNWATRIYDERDQSLTYVCDSPRILEQRVFSLARAIQQHLD
jgi:hypothetical protein